jgi:hypothetical protein
VWWRRAGHQVLTFNIVCLGWVFFRADSLSGAGDVLARLGSGWGAATTAITPLLVLTIAAVIAAHTIPRTVFTRMTAAAARLAPAAQVGLLAAALVVTDVLAPEGVAPFLYFGF